MSTAEITPADIEAAERLMGIAYTARERAQMAGKLEGQIASSVEGRKVVLGNSVPMALRFDPRPLPPVAAVPKKAGQGFLMACRQE